MIERGTIKRTLAGVLSLALCLCIGVMAVRTAGAADASSGQQKDPRQMKFEPVQFTPPDPERVVLENGMVVYLLEDHELPLVTITATIRTGGWLDPAEKVGLGAITGESMRERVFR